MTAIGREMKELIPELSELCREVMEEVIKIYDEGGKLKVNRKTDGSPVTNADMIANEIIVNGLKKITPGIPIISEEMPLPEYRDRKNSDYLWMVDPIDGTYGLIERSGDFTINLALIKDHAPVIGMVGVPVSGEIYSAVAGGGAQVEKNGHRSHLEANIFSKKDRGLRFICSPNQEMEKLTNYFEKFDQPRLKYRSGTIKFLLVASGQADIYPSIRRINEWDTAAGQLIIEEAGGVVLRADNDQPLKYNKPDLRNPPFIAYGDIKDFP
ncbi:MAG: 3'(2'),5'-bisphosphate nucleotidase CysQ [Saprospirales bacterium]|nr:MAG: 3'(2'),5'-bisphosphate nucleotidase CysQ [Saprospirales bacterium]